MIRVFQILAVLATVALVGAPATARSSVRVKNVVLVHGAFADASSWSKVIPLLEAKGFHVTAVGNPLTSFADDLAATKRALAVQDGPVLLVAHSWGGVVITEAGNDPKVAGLVYVAAFAPDAGQSINDLSAPYPKAPGLDKVVQLSDGFAMLSPDGIENYFAPDLSKDEKALLVATQPHTSGTIFEAKPSAAAWRLKPSWFIVASEDKMIVPEQQKSMAKTIKAATTVLPSSHVAMQSHPKEVAKVIEEAAASLQK
jgi:pimeloyl-ACP methyl ester carboxylesterase